MHYTSRYSGPELLPEEQEVKAALHEYTTEGAVRADWVSTEKLRQIYRDWRARHRWRFDPEAPAALSKRQFGHAVRRLFPDAERCRRVYHGRQSWGYCYLIGPESMRSPWVINRSASR